MNEDPAPRLLPPELVALPPAEVAPARANCGFEVIEDSPPAADSCAVGEVLLGPETIVRSPGEPLVAERRFSARAAGEICLVVTNAAASSARFILNGDTLLGPDEFNPHVTRLERRAAVSAGPHRLWFTLASAPGTSVTYEVRFAAGERRAEEETTGERGILRLRGLNDAPDPFSPNGDSRLDETEFSVLAEADRFPGARGFRYVVSTAFEVYSATACGLMRRLETTVDADPTARISYRSAAAWGGRDGSGAVVADGRYFYRAVTRLVRVNAGGVAHVLDTATSWFRTVTIDTAPPGVVLDPDPEGLITSRTPLPVTGYVQDESDVRVIVGGADAVLIDSRFSGSAPLVEGA
ncbi:MAG: hypothetical protein QME96_18280, partial [Myxococcota bacterium]|nr:hypothetical protein [Myxococcota bacterium]